jgi:5-formyltetrahydrofolate cyclo-ligase
MAAIMLFHAPQPALPPQAQKHALRAALRRQRRVIPADISDTTRWKAINHLRSLLSGMAPGTVALYSAQGTELDLTPLAEELWRAGQTVCLPRVVYRGHPLTFNIWQPYAELEPDALGIPAATGEEITPSVIIMPMLGYSRSGYRLGSGGGYYDHTLRALRQPATTIGVCHTGLEIAAFPAEEHDIPLNHIVTGREVITLL